MSIENSKYAGQIIPSEYGGGFQIVATAPARRAPRVDAPPMTLRDIRATFNVTEEQLAWVLAHPNFPAPTTNYVDVSLVGFPTSQTGRNAEKVLEFFAMGRQIFGGR
jgi:hypothetical protein